MEKHEHSLFFVDSATEGKVLFSREELHQALGALRIEAQALLQCTDGLGGLYTCVQTSETAASGEALIVEAKQCPRVLPSCEVYIGLPQRDAFEEALTHVTALGVARVIPLHCRFSQNTWWNYWNKYAERFRRKMISGIKQSHNPWLPHLAAPQNFVAAVEALGDVLPHQCLIADAGGQPFGHILSTLAGVDRVACFVGPPGGFSPQELDDLQSRGCTAVNIGPYRLRTELAAVVLCAGVMQARQR